MNQEWEVPSATEYNLETFKKIRAKYPEISVISGSYPKNEGEIPSGYMGFSGPVPILSKFMMALEAITWEKV